MRQYDRLFVLWSAPEGGTRHVIGHLWRDDQRRFAFAYVDDITPARTAGFSLLPEFPEHRGMVDPYMSRQLFSTFAQRIPSPRRPDFDRMMTSWGVQDRDDPLEILALSGGFQMTDRIELSEYRPSDDDLGRPLVCRVAGSGYHPGQDAVKSGDQLELIREEQNPHDPNATIVLRHGTTKVGYVPRQYAPIVARLLDAGHPLRATALRQLTVPARADRWVIEIRTLPTA